MQGSTEARLAALEREIEGLRARLEQVERPAQAARPAARQQPAEPPPRPSEPVRPPISVEDLLGGRVLAWVGGAAVVLGVV